MRASVLFYLSVFLIGLEMNVTIALETKDSALESLLETLI